MIMKVFLKIFFSKFLVKIFVGFFVFCLILQGFLVYPVKAFGANSTAFIHISVSQKSSNIWQYEYQIAQNFAEKSRGIFLTLPKLQNGVWTEYEVQEVKKSKKSVECELIFVSKKSSLSDCLNKEMKEGNFSKENFNRIAEVEEFRMRVGKANSFLENGLYLYKFTITAKTDSVAQFEQTLIQNWLDPLNEVLVYNKDNKDNQNIVCSGGEKSISKPCMVNGTLKIKQNNNLEQLPIWQTIWKRYWIYALLTLLVIAIFVLAWRFWAKDPNVIYSHNSAKFEPPNNLLPWQAQYLIKDGRTDVKNTLISYILWLNHKKIINLQPSLRKNQSPTLSIKSNLPLESESFLPDIFNQTVSEIEKNGFKKGILASKINPGQHNATLNETIQNSLQTYFSQKPIHNPIIYVIIIIAFGAFVSAFGFGFLQEKFLIGSSILWLIAFTEIISIPGFYILFYYWGKLTKDGVELRDTAHQYKYYIQKAEQIKLDFSNNPSSEVQHYLNAVPYAASFGLLAGFNKFIKKMVPDNQEVDSAIGSYNAVRYASFYTPPSSSSGGSGGFSGGGFSGGGGSW